MVRIIPKIGLTSVRLTGEKTWTSPIPAKVAPRSGRYFLCIELREKETCPDSERSRCGLFEIRRAGPSLRRENSKNDFAWSVLNEFHSTRNVVPGSRACRGDRLVRGNGSSSIA